MKTLTIRGIDIVLDKKIKERSNINGESINKTILNLLNSAFGLDKKNTFSIYHDLDYLAGTWTEDDLEKFNNNIKEFNEIDKDLWK